MSNMEWDVESIVSQLGINYVCKGTKRRTRGISSIKEGTKNDLSFCRHEGQKGLELISNSNSGVILCKKSMKELVQPKQDMQLIFLDNPRLVFVQISEKILGRKRLSGISAKAVISKNAKIGKNCYVGDFTKIGNNCTISDNSIIYGNVTILQNCSIGKNCIIQPGVVIGADGFSFERHCNGDLQKFPHIANVVIKDNVQICSNSSIARGSLSDTIIGEGTKIDALVHIAHNVVIGRNCELTAGTVIGGSTTMGNMCWTGLNSTIKDNIEIGNNVIIAAGAMVINNIQDNDIVAGMPAKSIKEKVRSDQTFLMAAQQDNMD